MSINHNITLQWTGSAGTTSLAKTATASGAREVNITDAIPENASTSYVVAFTKTKLQSIYVLADIDILLETNAAGGGSQDDFTITANTPFVWVTGSGLANPFANNVTLFYATPSDADTDGTLEVRLVETT